MIKFIRNIREIYRISLRLSSIDSEIKEIDNKISTSMARYSKEFENKIQQMTFAYTKNLDDTKSDYLKRYLEARMDGVQYQLSQLPHQISCMRSEINIIALRIENIEE